MSEDGASRAKLVGTVRGRQAPHRGESARGPCLLVDRGLKSGKLDVVPLTRRELLQLIASASVALERELEEVPVA